MSEYKVENGNAQSQAVSFSMPVSEYTAVLLKEGNLHRHTENSEIHVVHCLAFGNKTRSFNTANTNTWHYILS
jgi:hypothetical protein